MSAPQPKRLALPRPGHVPGTTQQSMSALLASRLAGPTMARAARTPSVKLPKPPTVKLPKAQRS